MDGLKTILTKYYETYDTKDLATLFQKYMVSIGANKLDRRRKDTSNTYMVDGEYSHWNKVECYYYRNSGDYKRYGDFEFSLVLRKRNGSYFLIELGHRESNSIERAFEVSRGDIICASSNLMYEIVQSHRPLFKMMAESVGLEF